MLRYGPSLSAFPCSYISHTGLSRILGIKIPQSGLSSWSSGKRLYSSKRPSSWDLDLGPLETDNAVNRESSKSVRRGQQTRSPSSSSLSTPPSKSKPIKHKNKPKKVDETGMFLENRPEVPLNWRKMSNLDEWQRQMFAIREKFHNQPWNPGKKVSRNAMESIRYLKAMVPDMNASEIAKHYELSPEGVRRILKSKWKPTGKEAEDIERRWRRRGERIRMVKEGGAEEGEEAEREPTRDSNTKAGPRRSRTPSRSPKKTQKRRRDIGDMYF